MSAELLGCEGLSFQFVNVVDSVVGKVFMVVNCCDIELCGCGMLWKCGGVGYVGNISFFVVVKVWLVGL